MKDYTLTVGLEIHAELSTRTKMFCDCKNDPEEKNPNVNVCPICMGYPGTLPVINKDAVKSALLLGAAIGGKLADFTEFDRKNYFYPDIPKGYQITQYKYPFVSGGKLADVSIHRVHLEEDTAKSTHPELKIVNSEIGNSLIDFNRSGVPLMELVTEPVIKDPETAGRFAEELQLLLTTLKISHANMEKGEMRIEANISVSSNNDLGTKVEVKNLNSFRSAEKAIQFEFERQTKLLETGEKVIQETRGWDEEKEETYSQRGKEEAHDYRYFPEPDLPKLFISEIKEWQNFRDTLPELPEEKRNRYKNDFNLNDSDTEIYVHEPQRGEYLEKVALILKDKSLIKIASNYILTDLKSFIPENSLAEVVMMINTGELSSRGAKEILKIIEREGGEPRDVASKHDLIQKNDPEEMEKVAKAVIDKNREAVNEYKKGKVASIQFLVGEAMKESYGSGNPKILKETLEKLLKS